jgi:hypothetical protein
MSDCPIRNNQRNIPVAGASDVDGVRYLDEGR